MPESRIGELAGDWKNEHMSSADVSTTNADSIVGMQVAWLAVSDCVSGLAVNECCVGMGVDLFQAVRCRSDQFRSHDMLLYDSCLWQTIDIVYHFQ